MQKLEERNTYTPTDVPQVCSNCGLLLNSPEGRDSTAGLKASSNNSDAALTHSFVDGEKSFLLGGLYGCICFKQVR